MINPAAGNRLSPQIYSNDVEPMFQAAGFVPTVQMTTYAGHCFEILRTYPANELFALRAIVIVSGDGLVVEAFNGLSSRESDGDRALAEVNLAVIPGGSGNGFCK